MAVALYIKFREVAQIPNNQKLGGLDIKKNHLFPLSNDPLSEEHFSPVFCPMESGTLEWLFELTQQTPFKGLQRALRIDMGTADKQVNHQVCSVSTGHRGPKAPSRTIANLVIVSFLKHVSFRCSKF